MRDVLGDRHFSTLETQPGGLDDLEAVLSRLDRLPLVVNVIAAYLKRNSHFWSGRSTNFFKTLYSDVFTKNSSRIRIPAEELLESSLAESQYGYVNVYAALLLSIDRLDEGEREAYELFLVLPRGRAFSEEMPGQVWNVSHLKVQDRLERFCSLNLLQRLHCDVKAMRCWYRLHNLIYNTFLINYTDEQRRQQHQRLVNAYRKEGLDKIPCKDLYFYQYFADHCRWAGEPEIFREALQSLNYLRNRLAIQPECVGTDVLELISKDIEKLDIKFTEGDPITILCKKFRRLRDDPLQLDDLDTSLVQQCLLLSTHHPLHQQARRVKDQCLWVANSRELPSLKGTGLLLWLPQHCDWLLVDIVDNQWRLMMVSSHEVVWEGPAPLPGNEFLSTVFSNGVAFSKRKDSVIAEFSLQTRSWHLQTLNGTCCLTCMVYDQQSYICGLDNGSVLRRIAESTWTEIISLDQSIEIRGLIITQNPHRCIAYNETGAIATFGSISWRLKSQQEWCIKAAVLSSDQKDLLLLTSRYQNPIFFSCRILRIHDGQEMIIVKNCCIDGSNIIPNPHNPIQFAIPAKNGLTIISYTRGDVKYEAEEHKRRGFEVGNAVWCNKGQCLLFTAPRGSCCCYNMRSETMSLTFMSRKGSIRGIHHEGSRQLLLISQERMMLYQQLQNSQNVKREEDSGCERPSDTDEDSFDEP